MSGWSEELSNYPGTCAGVRRYMKRDAPEASIIMTIPCNVDIIIGQKCITTGR
jgi:hypothetical protein